MLSTKLLRLWAVPHRLGLVVGVLPLRWSLTKGRERVDLISDRKGGWLWFVLTSFVFLLRVIHVSSIVRVLLSRWRTADIFDLFFQGHNAALGGLAMCLHTRTLCNCRKFQ